MYSLSGVPPERQKIMMKGGSLGDEGWGKIKLVNVSWKFIYWLTFVHKVRLHSIIGWIELKFLRVPLFFNFNVDFFLISCFLLIKIKLLWYSLSHNVWLTSNLEQIKTLQVTNIIPSSHPLSQKPFKVPKIVFFFKCCVLSNKGHIR